MKYEAYATQTGDDGTHPNERISVVPPASPPPTRASRWLWASFRAGGASRCWRILSSLGHDHCCLFEPNRVCCHQRTCPRGVIGSTRHAPPKRQRSNVSVVRAGDQPKRGRTPVWSMSPSQELPDGQRTHPQSCLLDEVMFKYWLLLQSARVLWFGFTQDVLISFGIRSSPQEKHLSASRPGARYFAAGQSEQTLLAFLLLYLPALHGRHDILAFSDW